MASSIKVSIDDEIENEWQKFKINHLTSGGIANDDKPRQIFADNYRLIVKHNSEADKGLHTYRLGVNQFTHMTADEFNHKVLGFKADTFVNRNSKLNISEFTKQDTDKLPASVDWTPKESRVKNQGGCGSCFAFAAVDTVESHFTITSGQKIELSPQNIIDCLGRPDVCTTGGSIIEAYEWIHDNGGVESEQDYPYHGDYQGSKYDQAKAQVTLSGIKYYGNGDEDVLKCMLANGPVAIAIYASNKLQHYQSGIFSDDQVGQVNHAVVVVGYGSEQGKDYWLIKNTWDTVWGEDGYFKLARNQGNMCQVGTYCVYPTGVEKATHN